MGIHTYAIGNVIQIIIMAFFFISLIMLSVSGPALNLPAYELKCKKIIDDPAAVTACENAAALGNNGCVNDYIDEDAWVTWPWFVVYFTITLLIAETFFVMLYLMFQKYGITWFIMVFWMIIVGIWLVIVIIQLIIWWVECGSNDLCPSPKYSFDFTGTVNTGTSAYWIVFNVAVYIIALAHIALFFASIGTQACLSRSVSGREDGLDPLFTKEDKQEIREANRSTSIDSSIGGVLPEYVRKSIKHN